MSFQVDFVPPPISSVANSYLSNFAAGGSRPSVDLMFGATQFLTANNQPDQRQAPSEIIAMSPKATDSLARSSQLLATQIPKGRYDQSAQSPTTQILSGRNSSEIDKISQSRIRLLALKYTNDSIPAEMIARLEILNSRLSENQPRVTSEQISSLENSIGLIKSIGSSRLARAARLGIKL